MAEIDTSEFANAVASFLERREMSYRQAVARWPDLNVAMLSRVCNEQPVSAANMLAICRYLGLDPFAYLINRKRRRFTVKGVLKQAVTADVSREKEDSQ